MQELWKVKGAVRKVWQHLVVRLQVSPFAHSKTNAALHLVFVE